MFPYVLFFFRQQAGVVNLFFKIMGKDSSKFLYLFYFLLVLSTGHDVNTLVSTVTNLSFVPAVELNLPSDSSGADQRGVG
jgi:hypothetical protein